MKILLLGADGQVGWSLRSTLAPLGELQMATRHDCDLADVDALRRSLRRERYDVVVNAAAYTAVDRAESEPELAFRINAAAPEVMAQVAPESAALLVHYSTDYVFPGAGDAPYTETALTGPLSVYGQSKLAGEEAIRQARAAALVFRTSWVFGAHGQNFVKTILRLAQQREHLRVVDDQWGAPTPAELIAAVTGYAIYRHFHGQRPLIEQFQLFHLAARGVVTWCEFARQIVTLASALPGVQLALAASGIEAIPTQEYPLPAPRPRNSRLDCHRLEQACGLSLPHWQPYLQRVLAEILRPSC